ncbi:Conserved_hypothetical protein [Hexamita inflata]|uniref:Uncharacterized protein n=1 Tax=Hexamita inflata TaxID=28002 RepID=A0AA86TVK4_9EUKA|nr:Conserved hypothetical protein [Hexamita inflata]CAI9920314.1 Conserved hypothetical protein [Hexamita inflata]CAI9928782.1 Conserved hypothetical protein [Hexamita inflata]
MLVIYIIISGDAVSYSDCFSPRSYINGDEVTSQLYLHLLPFEALDLVVSENLCKSYLPGKIVVAQIHFDDISFPTSSPQVKFTYIYNKEIIVSFQLSPTDYAHVMDKDSAMYELWYDVNLIKVNNSVGSIILTKYNGTNCFQKLELVYSINGDMDVNIVPNQCEVKLTNVYIEFQEGLVNRQLPIYPCTSGCATDEFQLTSANFDQIKKYKVRKSGIENQIQSFYQHFVENRNIRISFNLKFDTNGIDTVITRVFDNIIANDTLGCKTNDANLILYGVLNPFSVQIQVRESFKSQLICDMTGIVSVKAELYLWDDKISERVHKTLSIDEYNNQVGMAFKNTPKTDALRNNYNNFSKATIVFSFMDINSVIKYEMLKYKDKIYLACVQRASLHLYKDYSCIDYYFDNTSICTGNIISGTGKNQIAIFYQDNGITESLGQFKFTQLVDYGKLKQRVCFTCEHYFLDTVDKYYDSTCQNNLKQAKIMLKKVQIGFVINSKFEFIIFHTTVVEYINIYIPLTIAVISVTLLTFVALHIQMQRNTK